MRCVGIDGCKYGWAVAWITSDSSNVGFELYTTLKNIPFQKTDIIWIDMPIGMPPVYAYPRQADTEARKLLGRRGATVFSVPARPALEHSTYSEANAAHKQLTDRGMSKQVWHLAPKMFEVEQFLSVYPEINLWEAHPELVGAGLNDAPLMKRKKKIEGKTERMELLRDYGYDITSSFEDARRKYLKKEVADDDLIDAALLAVAADSPECWKHSVPENPANEIQAAMRIHYVKSF
ncbi:putative RNase H-like nuclease [Salsuginibacillus halophilus]|uniref:Putative RNase H-like nuclease n=1 Tax=Salsuginibacillus halophilus TaxID=517424 RepID=A0A2P8H9W8_9BACI|nr:DUF429 domain-containing protein [Salsuginibacillus halophilus]PSL42969.1 putative RNase H-like nuclease [Salsuginibacillus halophilus]